MINYLAADFYIGRGKDGVYLGTAFDALARSQRVNAMVRFRMSPSRRGSKFTEESFRSELALLARQDGQSWAATWPHDYETSAGSSWTYVYDKGSVYVYRWGVQVAVIYCNDPADREHGRKVATMPRFTPVTAER